MNFTMHQPAAPVANAPRRAFGSPRPIQPAALRCRCSAFCGAAQPKAHDKCSPNALRAAGSSTAAEATQSPAGGGGSGKAADALSQAADVTGSAGGQGPTPAGDGFFTTTAAMLRLLLHSFVVRLLALHSTNLSHLAIAGRQARLLTVVPDGGSSPLGPPQWQDMSRCW